MKSRVGFFMLKHEEGGKGQKKEENVYFLAFQTHVRAISFALKIDLM